MKRTIWQSAYYEDPKDWVSSYREYLYNNELTEEDKSLQEFISDQAELSFDDAMIPLSGIFSDDGYVVIENVGLWFGRKAACGDKDYRSLVYAIKDCVVWREGHSKIYVEDGDLNIEYADHDGTTFYVIRKWAKGLTDEQKDEIRLEIEKHGNDATSFITKTEDVGPEIAKEYGWDLDGHGTEA